MSSILPDFDLDRLEILIGESTPAAARVYVRLSGVEGRRDIRLEGKVYGPLCPYARTLPAQIPLVDQRAGETLLAQAVIPDPCFWSPEMPFLYRVTVDVRVPGSSESGATLERTIGIRPVWVRGRRLIDQGKSWVLRGASRESVTDSPLELWHDAGAAMLVQGPSDELCREASRIGVLLVAQVTGPVEHVIREVQRLADYPAVGFALLAPQRDLDESVRQHARQMLLCQSLVAGHPLQPRPWAQVAVCPADDVSACTEAASACSLPLIALRRLTAPMTPQDARAACDRLQRDLAGLGDYAGYMV